jgi:hypothetical protein
MQSFSTAFGFRSGLGELFRQKWQNDVTFENHTCNCLNLILHKSELHQRVHVAIHHLLESFPSKNISDSRFVKNSNNFFCTLACWAVAFFLLSSFVTASETHDTRDLLGKDSSRSHQILSTLLESKLDTSLPHHDHASQLSEDVSTGGDHTWQVRKPLISAVCFTTRGEILTHFVCPGGKCTENESSSACSCSN